MVDREKVIKGLEHCSSVEGCKGCPYNKTESGHACSFDSINDALVLLKEQEAKTGHWIFESQRYEAWTHTCSECGKRMTTAVNTFANWCWNCGAKMETGGEVG